MSLADAVKAYLLPLKAAAVAIAADLARVRG
jgi:hypothetical protein